jgi:hypothetical protein
MPAARDKANDSVTPSGIMGQEFHRGKSKAFFPKMFLLYADRPVTIDPCHPLAGKGTDP